MKQQDKQFSQIKKRATIISIISNSVLIIFKIIVGILSGSISIISEAIHSFSDLLASFIAYFSVKMSSQPADKDHSFGHGKYEDLSGLIEGSLIILASLYITYEATKKIIFSHIIDLNVDLAIAVMCFSAVVNIFVSIYLFKVAKKTESLAIYADAEHLRTDVVSSFSICLGLVLIKITNLEILDPVIAIIVAVIIFIAGAKIFNETKNRLVDKSLSEEDLNKIKNIVNQFVDKQNIYSLKELKTTKSGVKKIINMIIVADENLPLSKGHAICNKIEHLIEKELGNTEISIHLEPDLEEFVIHN